MSGRVQWPWLVSTWSKPRSAAVVRSIFPVAQVAYPASRRQAPQVGTLPSNGVAFPYEPTSDAKRPVISDAREGAQTGLPQYVFRKVTPIDARRAKLGVCTGGPLNGIRPVCWSEQTKRRF